MGALALATFVKRQLPITGTLSGGCPLSDNPLQIELLGKCYAPPQTAMRSTNTIATLSGDRRIHHLPGEQYRILHTTRNEHACYDGSAWREIRSRRPAMAVVRKPAPTVLTAILEPAERAVVASCPELDLVTEADSPDEALADLIDMALDYSEQYMAEFERFSQSPNRAGHAGYIRALRADPTPAGARALFEA